jgi:methionine-rich copper-binding protein CopC
MTRQWRRSPGIGIVLALLLTLIGTSAVSAHARLTSSVPAKDSTVTTVPTQVLLTFSQETSATQSTGSVVNASGTTVSTGFKVDLNQRTNMTIALQPSLPNGVYTVKYHTLTEDDNGTVDDSFNFTIQAPQQAATTPAATAPATTTTTGSPASGTTAPTATTAPAAAGSVTTTSATTAPTATRPAASAVATGTGGATLPTTGSPGNSGGPPWLLIAIVAGGLALVAGFALRKLTRRSA